MLHAHAWLKLCLSIQNKSSSCHLSGTACRLIRTARLPCCSPHYLHPTSPALSGSCSTSFQPRTCADSHGLGGDGFTASDPLTGCEPKMAGDKTVIDIFNPIVTEQEGTHSTENQELYSTEESQIPEIEDNFSLPYNQSSLPSTQDSMESLSTPQEADDEQVRILLASPRYLPEREASAERSQTYHPGGQGLMSSSSESLNFRHKETCGMALTSEMNGTKRLF